MYNLKTKFIYTIIIKILIFYNIKKIKKKIKKEEKCINFCQKLFDNYRKIEKYNSLIIEK